MRKFVVLSFITLDGVMQAPGGPEEDPSAGFKIEGWSAGYFDAVVANYPRAGEVKLGSFDGSESTTGA